MRRYLPAAVIAILMLAVATPANAGYLIIRIILEGSGPGEGGYGPSDPGSIGGAISSGEGYGSGYGGYGGSGRSGGGYGMSSGGYGGSRSSGSRPGSRRAAA